MLRTVLGFSPESSRLCRRSTRILGFKSLSVRVGQTDAGIFQNGGLEPQRRPLLITQTIQEVEVGIAEDVHIIRHGAHSLRANGRSSAAAPTRTRVRPRPPPARAVGTAATNGREGTMKLGTIAASVIRPQLNLRLRGRKARHQSVIGRALRCGAKVGEVP